MEACEGSSGESEGEISEKSPFPGLNKAHGFFNLIKRNQKDRDSYHQEQEQWKQVRKQEVEKEVRQERESRRRPPIALYRPPHRRGAPGRAEKTKNTSTHINHRKFQVEVELQPQQWWSGVVQCGEESLVAEQLAKEYHLTPPLRDALLQMMMEFQQKYL